MSRRHPVRMFAAAAATAAALATVPAASAFPSFSLPSFNLPFFGSVGTSEAAEDTADQPAEGSSSAGLPTLPDAPELPSLSSLADDSQVARSGAGIAMTYANGTQAQCTLNSIAERDGVAYGITAGHCLDSEADNPVVRISTTNEDVTLADADDLAAGGYILEGDASPFTPTGALDDFGYFRLNDDVQQDPTGVASRPNTGLPLLDAFLAAPRLEQGEPLPVSQSMIGSIVCKDGAMTGRTCGVVLWVNEESQEVFAAIPAIAGDSGSPLWIVGQDGRTHVVGTLSNGTPVLFNIFDGTQQQLARIGA